MVLESAFVSTVRDEAVWHWMTLGIVGVGICGIAGTLKDGAIDPGEKPAWLGKLDPDWLPVGPDGPTDMQVCQAGLPGG